MTNSKSKVEIAPDVKVSQKEMDEAHKEGALDAVREGGKAAVLADTGTTGDFDADAVSLQVAPDLQSTFLAPLLDLPLDTLVKRLTNDKVADHIGFEDAKGLLHLERCGQNRTPYVQALMKRLGVKDPRDVTSAGPGYTVDVSNVSHLDDRA